MSFTVTVVIKEDDELDEEIELGDFDTREDIEELLEDIGVERSDDEGE